MTNDKSNNLVRILIIIPCYNEEDSIAAVIQQVNSQKFADRLDIDVLAINDCSTDNTLEVMQQSNCKYLNLPINLGIGGAMHAGYKYAFQYKYDIAVQMDGDGQHPAQELYKILQPILNNEADVVIGSRFITKQGFQSSLMRRVGINYFRWLNQLLIGITIHDSTSGFRAFNRKTLQIVDKYYPDEYPEPESIVQFGLSALRIKEVPVTMKERQGGVSSINNGRAIYYMVKVTLGILFIYIRLISKRNRKYN
ncbi:glycosyltransferase family 2 protein [Arsenicibacter rosenii]|uniref:Glycosyl transferase family 2 n=1 Tax=Arsenicibacter rosenii TaxID=1750698 RepID=A0A1S2VD71_9BACT|nr:glycosyltransferase family 2 protein [Arsenicibacter rosenii]OIN56360.1 glycosyl transferase family 2 [Arsenicibacter rosenii]